MGTSKAVVQQIMAKLELVADTRSRAMMGGWLVYVDEVLVGQINEGDLFIKASAFAEGFAPDLERRPPYDGAKPALVVPIGRLDDQTWLHELLAGSAEALRAARKRTPRSEDLRP